MKKFKLRMLFLAAASTVLATITPVQGQAGKVEAADPQFDQLQSPEIGGNTGRKSWKPKDWLEAEVKFKIDMGKAYKEAFVDSVTVKWYIAVKNPVSGSKRKVLLIEKEVEHVNVPVGEDVYTSVYLSPSAIKRISGSDRANKSVIEAIGGEILVNGTSRADNKKRFFSAGKKVGWWTSNSLSRHDRVPLLNKDETPFRFLWYDRYAQIKRARR